MSILIAIPVHNEEALLEKNISTLVYFCRENISNNCNIVIIDNQSNDRTAEISSKLAHAFTEVKVISIDRQGKGAAIREAWEREGYDIYSFMDADLATDLRTFPILLNTIKEGADIAIGSRALSESKVKRSHTRRITSLCYKYLLKMIFNTKISDAPCGFKAVAREVKNEIMPLVKDNEWFFDSEFVLIAEKHGSRIQEIPITWHDQREGKDKSRVNTFKLGIDYFKKVMELRKRI